MKRILSVIFIIIGLSLISLPTIKVEIINKNIKRNMKVLEDVPYERIVKNTEEESLFNYEVIEDVGIMDVIKGTIDFDNKYIIGQILIPDLDINLPILKGTTNTNLLSGVATMVPEQKMGEGNYPLAGHKMKQKNLLFGSLMDIEVGSLVYLTDKSMIYEYRIYDTVVVSDTSFEMLEDKKSEDRGKPIVSLMTCYYSSSTGKRFFALGELIDEYLVERQ